tara:strand:+ start:68 stop:814 length:747 start_codon:yes stop_codon:yes gene_type:complete
MTKKIELERLEKTSTLVRNIVLIVGALATAAIFLSDKLSTDLSVRANTLYIGGENTLLAFPTGLDGEESPVSGRLGTLTELNIQNNTELPVSLEVRIPKSYDRSRNSPWPLFSTVSAVPRCHLKKDEISITNHGLVDAYSVGSVEIQKFPPDCSLEVVVATTQVDENMRFMTGRVEVFYDGKKAEVEHPAKIYGVLGEYFKFLERRGNSAIFLFLLVPLITVIFAVVWVMEAIPKSSERSKEENSHNQ